MIRNYKTTKKDFKIFKKHCRHYIELLGLKDWEVSYRHSLDPLGLEKVRAVISASSEAMQATLFLSKEYGSTRPTDGELRFSAKHEVLHLVLWVLIDNHSDPLVPNSTCVSSEHALIQRLGKVIG